MIELIRGFAPILSLAALGSVALGLGIGLWQGDGLARGAAYGLYIGGALMVAYAFIAGAPPSGRKLAKQTLLKQQDDPRARAVRGEVPLLILGGVLLLAAGTLVELVV